MKILREKSVIEDLVKELQCNFKIFNVPVENDLKSRNVSNL